MTMKAAVTNGSSSPTYVVMGVNEKRKESWLLNFPSREVKCSTRQKKELSFSDSFPAIILYFQVSLSSQNSLGDFSEYFLENPSIGTKNPTLAPIPALPGRGSEGREGSGPAILGVCPT